MKVLKYYKPYVPLILFSFALLFAQAMCELALPDYMSNIVAKGVAVKDVAYILNAGLIMLLLSLASAVASVSVGLIASRVAAGAARDVRRGQFERVMEYSNAQFDKFSVATLITRNTNDITQVQMFSVFLIRMVCYAPILAIGGAIKAIQKSADMPGLAKVIFISIGIVIAGIAIVLMLVQPRFLTIQKMTDKLNLVAREGLTGTMVIRAFNNEKHEEKRFDIENEKLTKANLFVNRVMALLMPLMMLIMNGVSLAVVYVAAKDATSIADVANMMAFMQYAMQILISFIMMSMVFIMMPRAFVSLKRINEIFKVEPTITNKEKASETKIQGNVRLNDVSFQYPEADAPVLEHISFTASVGETIAFIGSTGSGKSTLIHLIPRLYDVTAGSIEIDGVDIRDIKLETLRNAIGFVPQKSILFSGTIEENIKYGARSASDEVMKTAAETAQASAFIKEKENGYQSEIAQGGTNVSGGQRQRLCIARALAKDAPIYIFDDSFSALDFKTDAALRKALAKTTANKTVFIVSSRVGTIMNADKIIVMDEGQIVGIGRHAELMKTCKIYSDIAKLQLSGEGAVS